MTKKLIIFSLMLITVMGMQAQSLIGTWKTVMNDDDDMYLIFNQSTLILKGVFTQSNPEVGKITVSILVPGTYTRSGNALSIKLKGEQADMNIDKMDLNDNLKKMLEEMPELKTTLDQTLEDAMSEGKDDLVKELSSLEGELEIESLTDTMLILSEDNEKLTFTRVR